MDWPSGSARRYFFHFVPEKADGGEKGERGGSASFPTDHDPRITPDGLWIVQGSA
jgi:hypothetical protein